MATVDDIDPVQKPSAGGEGDDGDDGPKDFKGYCQPENAYKILEKRWGIFTIGGFFVYSYHFTMCIWGVDAFCHYTRFLSTCTGAEDKYVDNSAILDGCILAITVFHMVEWIRQWVFLTSVLVGINWINVYYMLSINNPFGILCSLACAIIAFSQEECLATSQPGRVTYLKIQLATFFLYIMWCQMHIVMFKVNDTIFKPQPDEDGNPSEYTSWLQQQYYEEDEEDEDGQGGDD